MKKTIAILLAAAGMALGSEPKPIDLVWDNDTVNYSGTDYISVVFTLDFSAIPAVNANSTTTIFSWSGTATDKANDQSDCTYGVNYFYDSYDEWGYGYVEDRKMYASGPGKSQIGDL